MSSARPAWACRAVVVAFALSVSGCGSSSSTAPSAPTRQVAAVVTDTIGAHVAGTTVFAVRLDGDEFHPQVTDTSGVARFALHDGRWCLSTSPVHVPLLVAASTGQVAQHPAPAVDSVLFRLVVRRQSIVLGTITLTGQIVFGGTAVVVAEFPAGTTTADDGTYQLGPLPPGTWTAFAAHPGYQPKQLSIVVPAPGDTITAGMSFDLPPLPTPRP